MKPHPGPERVRLTDRLRALEEVVSTGRSELPVDVVEDAQAVLDRAGTRRSLSLAHTVVALAGATGSGKSSLFNEVAGMEVSRVGVRRPTTADPVACVWGTQGVVPLLEWLGVPSRHQVSRESVLDSGEADDLDGLVLLDLPDHDSIQQEHRETVDRLVELVDLFVWVLDPQKYADAALHEQYLQPLAAHQSVTVVVLNQVDRLSSGETAECVADLRRLLDDDGLDDSPVVALSAKTGDGVDEFVDLIRTAVTKRRSADQRIEADTRACAGRVTESISDVPDTEPAGPDAAAREWLVDELVDAADADTFAEQVRHFWLVRARMSTGWPPTRWLAGSGDASNPPAPAHVQRSRAAAAVRDFGDKAASDLPVPWGDVVRSETTDRATRAPDDVDAATAAADFGLDARPSWWRAANTVQWLALLTAVGGGVWVAAFAARSMLAFDVPNIELAGIHVGALLLAAGIVVGLVLAAASARAARRGARRWATNAGSELRREIERSAHEAVIDPIEAEVERYLRFHRALARAGAPVE